MEQLYDDEICLKIVMAVAFPHFFIEQKSQTP